MLFAYIYMNKHSFSSWSSLEISQCAINQEILPLHWQLFQKKTLFTIQGYSVLV